MNRRVVAWLLVVAVLLAVVLGLSSCGGNNAQERYNRLLAHPDAPADCVYAAMVAATSPSSDAERAVKAACAEYYQQQGWGPALEVL